MAHPDSCVGMHRICGCLFTNGILVTVFAIPVYSCQDYAHTQADCHVGYLHTALDTLLHQLGEYVAVW